MLHARIPEVGLEEVPDPRERRGRRWKQLAPLLKMAMVGMLVGCKSFKETEALSNEMSVPMRRELRIGRRVPDTTMRDVVVMVEPAALRQRIHAQVRAAHRRKALEPVALPFGVAAVDGKVTAIDAWDDYYAQRQSHSSGRGAHGLIRTQTCALVSARAKVCIDAVPIPSATNEMGNFEPTVRGLVDAYGSIHLFKMVTSDSGACSEANGRLVVGELGLHYLFGLKGNQPTLSEEARRLLGWLLPEQAVAETIDVVGRYTVTRRLYRTAEMAGYMNWDTLQTTLRVESEKADIETGEVVAHEDRYYISSYPTDDLSADQWLLLVRLHWGVENNCHNTWDTAFQEDDKPWIRSDPQGMLVCLLLRRLAYNMLALFRSVTQRCEERRFTPWKDLLRWVYNTMISATAQHTAGLRTRKAVAAMMV